MKGRRTFVFHCVLSLVFGGTTAWAQNAGTLSGRVVGPNGEPLGGASVSVNGTARSAVAKSDGSYRLPLPAGRYEVRARQVGYALSTDSVTITADAVTTKNFRFERVTTNLESVAILGTRGEERTVISAPVPIDVLSAAGHSADGSHRDGADDPGRRAVLQLSARDDRRRHRPHAPRDAARPGARPDARARQRQASPHQRARQRERLRRPRRRRRWISTPFPRA